MAVKTRPPALVNERPSVIERTAQPRYPNGERKLARDPFMQVTWALLGAAALAQLAALLALDILS